MSAQTTIETVEQATAAVYVDARGNLYCTYCYHEGFGVGGIRSLTVDGECFRCGKSGSQSIEIVTGIAVVEYPPCKIF